MKSPLHPWVDSKLTIAQCLAEGACGGGISEAYLIISAVLSRIASIIWPRDNKSDRIDRKRFVELWARYANANPHPNLISIPLLIAHLENERRYEYAHILRGTHERAFGHYSLLVIAGSDVDLLESKVLSICPGLTLQKIREFSYGNIFYEHVRSGYVHEYQSAPHASSHQMPFESLRGKGVSYVNDFEAPHRRIHFELPWLVSIVGSVTDATASVFVTAPHNRPKKWWLSGG